MQVWLRAGEVPLLVVGPVPHQGGVPLPQVPGQVQAIDAQGGGGQMDLCCAVGAEIVMDKMNTQAKLLKKYYNNIVNLNLSGGSSLLGLHTLDPPPTEISL